MSDRGELLEATLDSLPEGAALLGTDCHVAVWNQAAQAITGHSSLDRVGRPAPAGFAELLEGACGCEDSHHGPAAEAGRGFLVHIQHKLGHEVSVMARLLVLRDGMGARIGTAILFHPAECLDALPHGEMGEDENVEASQADLTDRLESLYQDFSQGGAPFGVLWITVDQAHELRKTHGAGACEAMLAKVEHTLAHGLRPGEHLGRWGEDEFLLISHERTAAMLAEHAQVLTGQARTADFRWWGDRVSLTVSVGAAQAESGDSLASLLERAQAALHASLLGGGNQVTRAPEAPSCSPS